MSSPNESRESDDHAITGHAAARRWPLFAATALVVVAAAILAAELTIVTKNRSVPPASVSEQAAPAPVPLSSQPFSFPEHPATVPDLKFVDATGRSVSLSDFKGRPVLLNVWATWCLPCRKEMPSLDRLQAKFSASKFLVLPLSIDRGGLPAVKKFYADLGLKSLGIYADESTEALHKLGLIGIPGTLLINADGQEIGRKLGPTEWDSSEILGLLQERFGLKPDEAAGGKSP